MMKAASHIIMLGDIPVEVTRKKMKTLRLGVYPPDGRVRMSVPLKVSDETVRRVATERLAWIERQREKFAAVPPPAAVNFVDGEVHAFLGKPCRLLVRERNRAARVDACCEPAITITVRPGSTREQREAALLDWYRDRLSELIPPLIDRWRAVMNVSVDEWRIRRMKTRWGSCNIAARRVWFSLELARKPEPCLEYIVVHELTHLLERGHGARFKALMDGFLPDWRERRKLLNAAVNAG